MWKVLLLLRTNTFLAYKKKRDFAKEAEFLGHVVSARGVAADLKKVAAMLNWPGPKDTKALWEFLSLTGYYRRFVKGYGIMAKPLKDLLKKVAFQWNIEAEQAFKALKSSMAALPTSAVPNFSKQFVVESDASSKGIGAVLLPDGIPLAFFSQTLSERAQRKSVHERELMAIVLAVQKWKHYLMGRHFIIKTDQRSLKFLTDQSLLGEEQHRWTSKLLGYDSEIQYKPGYENKAADGLSRQMMYAALSRVEMHEWQKWEEEIAADSELQRLMQAVMSSPQQHMVIKFEKGSCTIMSNRILKRIFEN